MKGEKCNSVFLKGREKFFSNMFCMRGEGNVYSNIRRDESVVQSYFGGVACNLLNNITLQNFMWLLK